MNHSFLIHSFADGHLGCFQHLAIVNCAAMNIGVHRSFWLGVSGLLWKNLLCLIDFPLFFSRFGNIKVQNKHKHAQAEWTVGRQPADHSPSQACTACAQQKHPGGPAGQVPTIPPCSLSPARPLPARSSLRVCQDTDPINLAALTPCWEQG